MFRYLAPLHLHDLPSGSRHSNPHWASTGALVRPDMPEHRILHKPGPAFWYPNQMEPPSAPLKPRGQPIFAQPSLYRPYPATNPGTAQGQEPHPPPYKFSQTGGPQALANGISLYHPRHSPLPVPCPRTDHELSEPTSEQKLRLGSLIPAIIPRPPISCLRASIDGMPPARGRADTDHCECPAANRTHEDGDHLHSPGMETNE